MPYKETPERGPETSPLAPDGDAARDEENAAPSRLRGPAGGRGAPLQPGGSLHADATTGTPPNAASAGELDEARRLLRLIRAQAMSAEESLDAAVRGALRMDDALERADAEAFEAQATSLVARIEAAEAALFAGHRRLDDVLFLRAAGLDPTELAAGREALASLEQALESAACTTLAVIVHRLGRRPPESLPTTTAFSAQVSQEFRLVLDRLRHAEQVAAAVAGGRGPGGDIDAQAWRHIAQSFTLANSRIDEFTLHVVKVRTGPHPVVERLAMWLGLADADAGVPSDYHESLSAARSSHPELLHQVSRWATPHPPTPEAMESFFEVMLEHLTLQRTPPALPPIPSGILARAATGALGAFRAWLQGSADPAETTQRWRQARAQVETTFALYRAHGAPRVELLRALERQLAVIDDVILGSLR